MGLLADAFSYGNGLKRKVNGLLADPVGTLELGANRLGEDQNKLLALMKDVMPAGRYVAPEVRKNALKELADYGSQVGMAGMFVGPKSQTWDKAAAAKAQELAKKGTDPRKIWSETGTWKGPDGHWRQEIPDNKAVIFEDALPTVNIDGVEHPSFKLWQSMGHKPLYEAYPATRNIDVSFNNGIGTDGTMWGDSAMGLGGAFRSKVMSNQGTREVAKIRDEMSALRNSPRNQRYEALTDGILERNGGNYNDPRLNRVINKYGVALEDKTGNLLDRLSAAEERGMTGTAVRKDAKDVMLHELQHSIQKREGWMRGGSPDASDALVNEEARKMYADNIDSFQGEGHELLNMARQNAYWRLGGEAEARATQARMNMDAAQRRATFPEDSYDVPINNLILRGLLAP